MPLCPSGYSDDLHAQLLDTCFAGLAIGTWRNRSTQVAKYIQFAAQHEFRPLHPEQYDVMAYTIHLSRTLLAPGTVINYMSGARTWVKMFGGDTSEFDSYMVALTKRGVLRLSSHTPSQAPPLTPTNIRHIVQHLMTAGPDAAVLIAALLIGYNTLLRQGNLITSHAFSDQGHTLR